jgi:hypothetical protein
MHRTICWTSLALVFCLGLGQAAEPDKKEAPRKDPPKGGTTSKANEMLVNFHDGTLVRILTLQETLEVETKYGKMTIPTGDIRKIEFGLHMSEDITKKVADAMRDLESDDFQSREDGGKRLVTLGRFAYPALVKASKGTNLELTRRIQDLLKEIKGKFPEGQLKMKTEDIVQTTEFTLAGRITTPSFKFRTEHFGDVQIGLAQLRTMRVLGGETEITVTVDASKYALNDNQWMPTDYNATRDGPLSITADGQVDLEVDSAGQIVSGPDGNKQLGLGRRAPQPPGLLLGKIGENGPVFPIGSRYKGTAAAEGKLYLRISPWPNTGGASGTYSVKISGGE